MPDHTTPDWIRIQQAHVDALLAAWLASSPQRAQQYHAAVQAVGRFGGSARCLPRP